MSSRTLTIVLLVGLALGLLLLFPRVMAYHLPGNNQDYEPTQPIAFSHRLHAGEMQVPCLYCHSGAERSRHAGIPSATVCMNCHRMVTAARGAVREEEDLSKEEKREPRLIVSPVLETLFDAVGYAPDAKGLMQRDPAQPQTPIAWVKVHNLPDFVYFDHRRHVNIGVACETCHGPVQTMERVRQVQDLSMGWCVNCHRDVTANGLNGRRVNASIDCSGCHY